MEPERRCARCGQIIPWGCQECPLCTERSGYFWWVRRDTFLAVVIGFLFVLMFFTGFAVRRFHALERNLAQDWYRRGQQALEAGRARQALSDFRNALAYARENPLFELRLAQALEGTGRDEEARIYLLSLREREPGDGLVNLELARLAAREHAIPEAVQYYHDAVYCEWSGDPVVQRRAVRLELVKFLLASDQKSDARAELIAVAANLPPDPSLQTPVAQLLVQAGGIDDALRLFRQALTEEPHLAQALAGLGECYFLSNHFPQAELYLTRALQHDPKLTQVAQMRSTAQLVMNLDPFIRSLHERERESRARQDFEQAMTRLASCAAQRRINLQAASGDPLQTLYIQATAFRPIMARHRTGHDSEWVASTMDLVFEIEKAASQMCGEPHGPDLALLLISRAQEGTQP